MASADGGVGLLAAAGLGGTTLVNYTFSFRTPDTLRARVGREPRRGGRRRRGLRSQPRRRLGAHRGQRRAQRAVSRRDETIREGFDKLGWQWQVMQRNVAGCTEEVCRLCHYGCQLGAKQSTLKTWVKDAYEAGTRVPRRDARRAGADRGRQGGRRGGARPLDGHRVSVRARAVVSACGALHTPVLCRARGSGLEHARQAPAAPPGAGHVGPSSTRRCGPGRGCSRRLLGSGSGHGRARLRREVRARGHPAEHPALVLAVARRSASTPS